MDHVCLEKRVSLTGLGDSPVGLVSWESRWAHSRSAVPDFSLAALVFQDRKTSEVLVALQWLQHLLPARWFCCVTLYVEQIICYSKIKPGSPWYKIQDPAIPWCSETFISALAEGVEAPVSRWELLQHVLCGCVTALRILRSPLTSLASTLGSKKGSEGAFSRSRALEQIWEAALC